MKRQHKFIITAFLLTFSVALFAQKQSKNYNETFTVKKDAIVEINASHADVEVTTWNKNQVEVKATITIEGLPEKEAKEYLKDFKFEALGNSSKVAISAGGNNSFQFGDNDFVIFGPEGFQIPDIDIPEINFQMPNIQIPEIDFQMPDMDWEKFVIDLDDVEFDFDQYSKDGKNYFFRWKDSVRDITIKNKKEWEKFKKSDDYKAWKKDIKENRKKMKEEWEQTKKEINGIDIQKIVEESLKAAQTAMENVDLDNIIKESMNEARKAMSEIDQEQIRKELSEVRRQFKKSYKNDFVFESDSGEVTINGKKVKITKKITVKVPKGVTLDLNTRHCQLKLPKMSASGKVSYGTFNAEGLNGGSLDIFSAPVQINVVTNTKLNLKNVTDATLASVMSSELNSDSGDLEILEVFSGTTINATFGDVTIKKVSPKLSNFKLSLNQSDGKIDLHGFDKKLNIDTQGNKGKVVNYDRISGKGILIKGSFNVSTQGDQLNISGKYSELTIKE
jgi:hypothetical protein